MQVNLSDEMIFVVSRCLAWMDDSTLRSIRMKAGDSEVDGLEARAFFWELDHASFGKEDKQ